MDDRWDAMIPKGHPLHSQNLAVIENSLMPSMNFAYLLIERDGIPIGLVYLQKIICNPPLKDIEIPFVLKKIVELKDFNLLICGNLFRNNDDGFYFSNPADNHLIFEILKVFQQKNPWKTSFKTILIKDSPIDFDPKTLKAEKFQHYSDDLLMEMNIPPHWNQFQDYLNELKKKYLQRAHKVLLAKGNIISRNLSISEINQFSSILENLYLQILTRQKIQMGKLNARYFIELKKKLGDDFIVVGYFCDEELIAFSSYIFEPDNTMEIHYIGIHKAYNEKHKLYFNIIFDGIETAIMRKKTSIKLGRTSLDAKASAGAVPKTTRNFYKVKSGLSILLFNYINRWQKIGNDDNWKTRQPFKGKVSTL